jgi:hypothetical protein
MYPFNSKTTNKPLDFWLTVPHTPNSEPLKSLAIGILEIVPHTAGVEGLFSMMSAIKTKSRNRLSPTTLKMMAQIKLHLLQGDTLLAPRKIRKQKNPTRDDSEYDNMVAYDSFITPEELDAFEEGISSDDPTVDAALSSREDAFVNTLFDFDLWESDVQKTTATSTEIEIVIDESNTKETNWDPQEL